MLNVTWACAPTAAQGPAERATNATAKRNSFFMVLCSLCDSNRGGLNPPRKTLTYRTCATQRHQAQLSRGDDGGDREFIPASGVPGIQRTPQRRQEQDELTEELQVDVLHQVPHAADRARGRSRSRPSCAARGRGAAAPWPQSSRARHRGSRLDLLARTVSCAAWNSTVVTARIISASTSSCRSAPHSHSNRPLRKQWTYRSH